MYGDDATYSGSIIRAREVSPREGPDAPGLRGWFHGNVTAPYRGETTAASWESIQLEDPATPGERSWFRNETATQHSGEKAVAPRDRSLRDGLAAPGLTGWYHWEEAVARLRESHRWLPRDSPKTAPQAEYHPPMDYDSPSIHRSWPSSLPHPLPKSRFMMTSSGKNVTSPLDNTKSAFREIKPTTPRKLSQDQLTSPQKCMMSYYRLLTPPYSTTTSQIKDEPDTAFTREKKPPPEGVISPVFCPVAVYPNGKHNENLMKSRHSNSATYQQPEMYAATYPPPATSMEVEVTSPTKVSSSGAIYSRDTRNATTHSVVDNSRAATYPFFSSSDATYWSSTEGVATYDRSLTKPWELYQGWSELFLEPHQLKHLQDLSDNNMKTLSEPLGMKQPATSPMVPHVSPDRPVSPTQRTSMSSPSMTTTSYDERDMKTY